LDHTQWHRDCTSGVPLKDRGILVAYSSLLPLPSLVHGWKGDIYHGTHDHVVANLEVSRVILALLFQDQAEGYV
jgi:hypothetical protein